MDSGKDLERRALAAYYRAGDEMTPEPSSAEVTELDDRTYVVVSNTNGTLAVYRVRPVDGRLHRLRRWPAGIR